MFACRALDLVVRAAFAVALGACSLRSATFAGVGGTDGGAGSDAVVLPPCNVGHTGRLTGTVNAPNGTLPLSGVTVYVAASAPGPLPAGSTCASCGALPGDPVVAVRTTAAGHFTLDGVPAAASGSARLVVQTGKWRRQIPLPAVAECGEAEVDPALTRLPRNRSEGDLPLMAIATSNDTLECLPEWVGVDRAEVTTEVGGGRVHLYAQSSTLATTTFAAGSTIAPLATLTGDAARLATYDLVLIGCDAVANPVHPPLDEQRLVDYANAGGRLMLGHFQGSWITGAPPPWSTLAAINSGPTGLVPSQGVLTLDTSSPRGAALTDWLHAINAAQAELFAIPRPRVACTSVDRSVVQPLITLQRALNPMFPGDGIQMFEFATPVGAAASCGRVVFSDIHANPDASNRAPYPGECISGNTPGMVLAAHELFELGACR